VPRAALPYQPSDPVLRNAIVTVAVLPGQSVGKPLRAKRVACAPGSPVVAATGATPAATESVQVTVVWSGRGSMIGAAPLPAKTSSLPAGCVVRGEAGAHTKARAINATQTFRNTVVVVTLSYARGR
jgi:hypothetical protein